MATKFGWVVTYFKGAPTHKVKWPVIQLFLREQVTNIKQKSLYLDNHNAYNHQLGRVMTHNKHLLQSHTILWSRGLARSRDKLNTLQLHLNWTNRHQTWQGGDLSWGPSVKKSHKPLYRWSREIRWQIWRIGSPFSQYLWQQNLAECWLQREGSEPKRLSRHRLLVSIWSE